MSAARDALNRRAAFEFITVEAERKEVDVVLNGQKNGFTMPNHNPDCTTKHLLLRFAYWQKGYGTVPDLPYFHVMSDFETTLSIEGLKNWGYIKCKMQD